MGKLTIDEAFRAWEEMKSELDQEHSDEVFTKLLDDYYDEHLPY